MDNLTLNNKLYDKSFREKLINDPSTNIKELGYDIAENVDVVVLINTKDVIYIPIPSVGFMSNDLNDINAAGHCIGSVGSVGTASTVGCATTSISTLGSAGSIGSAGSTQLSANKS